MEWKFYLRNGGTSLLRHKFLFSAFVVALVLFCVSPSMAIRELTLGGKPFRAMGFINQSVGWGIGGDEYDTQEGFQSAIYNVLLETKYELNPDLKIFVAGMLTGDWAYDILSDDDEWNRKGFPASRNNLSHDTVLRDLLQEAHITWNYGNFLVRLGKQIVVWGETDAIRLMDQINPSDQRRGITDVEFETTILPIWMVRFEYFMQPVSTWLQDVGFEFIFNPNADFEPNRNIVPGNDEVGIWGANVLVQLPPPPFGPGWLVRVGSFDHTVVGVSAQPFEEPDDWDSDYFEYGFRLKSVIHDTIITFNYFYGRDNDPAVKVVGVSGIDPPNPFDGLPIMHLQSDKFYPRFHFTGFTLSRDFENLYISALGGVAPTLRMEAFYAFNTTFTTTLPPGFDDFEKHDEIRYAIGVDWKVKVNWLNPRAYFMISPQFYHQHVMDYPENYGLAKWPIPEVDDNNYQTTLLINTTYFHNKLQPSFVWVEDWSFDSGFYIPKVVYEYSHNWNFTLGAIFINGGKAGKGFHPLENKDHIFFTVSYKF